MAIPIRAMSTDDLLIEWAALLSSLLPLLLLSPLLALLPLLLSLLSSFDSDELLPPIVD